MGTSQNPGRTMLSLLASTLALNARSALLNPRAPAASMSAVGSMEQKLVYRPLEPMAPAFGQATPTPAQAVDGEAVPTRTVDGSTAVNSMEQKLVYRPLEPMAPEFGQATPTPVQADGEAVPTRAVHTKSPEVFGNQFCYGPRFPLGKRLGCVHDSSTGYALPTGPGEFHEC